MNDTLKHYLNVFDDDIFRETSNAEVVNFGHLFCKILNTIYKTAEKSFQLFKILDAGKYFALHFEYSSDKSAVAIENTRNIEDSISSIIPTSDQNYHRTHIQKIMKIYGQDRLVLIKPKQLRYWLPSIALRDADDTFEDCLKSRYHHA